MEDYKIATLIEDFQSKLEVIGEGVSINRNLIEVIASEQKQQGETIDIIKTEIISLKKGQANLEDGQAVIKDKIANLEKGQANLESGQANLEKGQANLESGQEVIKDDLSEVKSMLHRKVDI